jgi:two-component system, LytTR family, sensor kinase
MRKAFVFLLHLGYWLLYLLLLAVIYATVSLQLGKTRLLPNLAALFPAALLFITPNLIAFYSFYFLLFSRFLSRKKFAALIVFGAAICAAAAVLGGLISIFVFGLDQPIFNNRREFWGFTASQALLTAIHGAIALVIRGFVTWYEEIKLKEELARKNFEIELSLIKSQINPHFLFNTLNNIDVLIGKNPERASEYLNKLSVILRYMVYETEAERIPLAVELEYIEKYLDLQKIRAANPDYVEFQTTGEAGNFAVAPMLFFPFVENAFKHTENKKNANSIRIKLLIEENKLVFECENSYQANGSRKPNFGGAGNDLIKKRLALIYPEKHDLKISDEGGIYKVKLTLYEN